MYVLRNQCEGKCIRGIKGEPVAIGQRTLPTITMQTARKPRKAESNGHGLPLSEQDRLDLRAQVTLQKWDIKVTIFEALHLAGGVLVWNSGIQTA